MSLSPKEINTMLKNMNMKKFIRIMNSDALTKNEKEIIIEKLECIYDDPYPKQNPNPRKRNYSQMIAK